MMSYSLSAHVLSDESLDVAEAIITMSKGIIHDINPPVIGAERIVTEATVSDDNNVRTYYIEGQDVYHTGRVLSTYWIRLQKQISHENPATPYTVNVMDQPIPLAGRVLEEEAQNLIASLLNGLYDIAEMDLDHRKVILHDIVRTNEEPLTYELVGENRVCEHVELNTFKIILTRYVERNRPSYVTELIKPYNDIGSEE